MSAPSDPVKPPTWPEWRARNGGKRWYRRLPLAIEWAFEWVNHGLHRWAFVEFLEYAGRFTILVVAVFWFLEADDRAKERHYRAWELINAARGSTSDGGRRDALQDLNRDGVSLAAAPLEKAHLPEVDLKGAILRYANLQLVDLPGANLQNADLEGSNLQEAMLWGANLEGANLEGANLEGANLEGASLGRANLQVGVLEAGAREAGGLQVGALQVGLPEDGALQAGAPDIGVLQGAVLWGANLAGAKLRGARLTQRQLDSALHGDDRTVLPAGLTRPAHWAKAQAPEGPPAAQPDAAGGTPAAPGAPVSGK